MNIETQGKLYAPANKVLKEENSLKLALTGSKAHVIFLLVLPKQLAYHSRTFLALCEDRVGCHK